MPHCNSVRQCQSAIWTGSQSTPYHVRSNNEVIHALPSYCSVVNAAWICTWSTCCRRAPAICARREAASAVASGVLACPPAGCLAPAAASAVLRAGAHGMHTRGSGWVTPPRMQRNSFMVHQQDQDVGNQLRSNVHSNTAAAVLQI
jgi:hypothetical protein